MEQYSKVKVINKVVVVNIWCVNIPATLTVTTQAEAEWSDAYGGGARGNFQYSSAEVWASQVVNRSIGPGQRPPNANTADSDADTVALAEVSFSPQYLSINETMGLAYSLFSVFTQTFPPQSKFNVDDIPDLTGKVIIVTGANAGVLQNHILSQM